MSIFNGVSKRKCDKQCILINSDKKMYSYKLIIWVTFFLEYISYILDIIGIDLIYEFSSN